MRNFIKQKGLTEVASAKAGEIATLLTVASLASIILGLILGVQNTGNVKKLNSSAQQSCTYDATAQVKKEVPDGRGGSTISALTASDNGSTMYVENDKGQKGNLDPISALFPVHFDPYPFIDYQDGDHATVWLRNLDTTKWRIKKVFCNGPPGRGCPFIGERSSNDPIIRNFLVTCVVQETYGWIVESTTQPTPTDNPRPTSVTLPTVTPPNACVFITTAFVKLRINGQDVPLTSSLEPDVVNWTASNSVGFTGKLGSTGSFTTGGAVGDYCCGVDNSASGFLNGKSYKVDKTLPYGDLPWSRAQVTLNFNKAKYRIVETCNELGCAHNSSSVISQLPVGCMKYDYGWILEELTPTVTPPKNPSITPIETKCDADVHFVVDSSRSVADLF